MFMSTECAVSHNSDLALWLHVDPFEARSSTRLNMRLINHHNLSIGVSIRWTPPEVPPVLHRRRTLNRAVRLRQRAATSTLHPSLP
jgi:hypothetical protein